jgi:hypothetical protein
MVPSQPTEHAGATIGLPQLFNGPGLRWHSSLRTLFFVLTAVVYSIPDIIRNLIDSNFRLPCQVPATLNISHFHVL